MPCKITLLIRQANGICQSQTASVCFEHRQSSIPMWSCCPSFICAASVLWSEEAVCGTYEETALNQWLRSLQYSRPWNKTLLHNLKSNPRYTKHWNKPKTFDCRCMTSSYIYDCRGVAHCLPAASEQRFLILLFSHHPHIKYRVPPDSSERESCVLLFSKRHQTFLPKTRSRDYSVAIILSKG